MADSSPAAPDPRCWPWAVGIAALGLAAWVGLRSGTVVPPVNPTTSTTATKDNPFVNSLGMEFVPVPGTSVLFCRWETRVKDYAAFAAATGHGVEKPDFVQTDDHPAVNVSWVDAMEFCKWLSEKDGLEYRLATDAEWSTAADLPAESGATPKDKNGKVVDVFPWGVQWPPPKGTGNFSDDAAKKHHPSWTIIDGYDDGFAETAPVGSFEANRFGLHDLSGNVWEWCEDFYDGGQTSRVLRGGSFSYDVRVNLLSSCRGNLEPTDRGGNDGGFRVVVVGASSAR